MADDGLMAAFGGGDWMTDKQKEAALGMGLLQMAGAMAQANAPRPAYMPRANMGEILGGGVGGFAQGMQGVQQSAMNNAKTGLMMDQIKSQKALQDWYGKNPDVVGQLGLPKGMPIDPSTLQKSLIDTAAKEREWQLRGKYEPAIVGETEAAKNPALVQREGGIASAKLPYELQRDAYKSGLDTNREITVDRNRIREVQPGGSLVDPGRGSVLYNSPNPAPGTQEGGVEKWFGEKYTGIQDVAISGRDRLNTLKSMDSLLGDVNTGKFGNTGLEIKKGLQRVGVNVDLPENIGRQEAAQAMTRELALQLRNPAAGAGMPGALSDSDRKFLESMTPGLETTPDGRKTLIQVQEKLQQRNEQIAQMARDYRMRNGGKLDDRFLDRLQEYSAGNPLFKPQENKTPAIPAPPQGFVIIGDR